MSHIDFQQYIEVNTPKKLVLLHHWDTDGLACAALFMNYIEKASPDTEIILMNPTVNNYFLTETEFEQVASYRAEALLTTDINFPLDVIERLETIVPHMFVFDHHSQTMGINRAGVQDVHYPGCSLLVNDYVMQPLSLTSVLGAVGDQEERIKERTDFYPLIEEMMAEHRLTFEQILRVSKLIDTMYMVGDEDGFAYVIDLLRTEPEGALTDERLLNNERRIKEEMDRELAKNMDAVGERLLYMPIDSTMSLISEVTRAKSREHADAIVLTDQIWGENASFYARRRDVPVDLGIVVDAARSKGFNAGGKPEVAGVVLPASALESFRVEVITLLNSL